MPKDAIRGRVRVRQTPSPGDNESHDDFMGRCTAALQEENGDLSDDDAEQMCEIAWEGLPDDARSAARTIKTKAAPVRDMMFTLSDETPDRYGDVVSAAGWELDNFRKNPIALFGHNQDFPIGRWLDIHVDAGALRATLALAPSTASARIAEIGTLIKAGIIKAVSVGFKPLSHQPLLDKAGEDTGGYHFIRQELLEASLVSVPANPNALSIAKALNVSPDTLKLVFAESGDGRQRERRRENPGESAATLITSHARATPMFSNLSQRIEDAQDRHTSLRDRLAEHIRGIDDLNPTDNDNEVTMTLTKQISTLERHIVSMRESEKALAPNGAMPAPISGEIIPPGDPDPQPRRANGRALALAPVAIGRADGSVRFAQPRATKGRKKELDAVDYIVRNGVIMLAAHRTRKSVDDIRKSLYGDDEPTRISFEMIQKATTLPATTTTVGWAAELVTQIQGPYYGLLMPAAVFPQLASRGVPIDFGQAGRIALPTRSRVPTIAGAFVGEGAPIPVKQGAFSTRILTPKKLGVITVMTREIEEHSIPAIEGILRDAIGEDTGVSIDSVLLDATAASTIRPAGLKAGVAAIVPSPITGDYAIPLYRMTNDLKLLVGAIITATFGNLRQPVWMMNPLTALTIALMPQPGGGDPFPFKAEIEAGTLLGYPVIESTSIPAREIDLIDAADFIVAGQGGPVFEVSDQATLHMDDAPDAITGPGPTDIAVPVRSLWQTDSFALRMMMRLNWTLRRPMFAWMQNVLWMT